MQPLVSVIIATRNRQALLAQTLEALRLQEWPGGHFEVIVADNGSRDDTCGVVSRASRRPDAPPLRYLFVATPGKSSAVNAALDIARGEIFALTDDDVRAETTWLASVVSAFERPDVDFVAGRIWPIWETPPPSWMSPALYGVLAIPDNGGVPIGIDGPGAGVMPIGANMAVRRAVVDRIGGFRADLGKLAGSLRTGEDHEFFFRMIHAGFRGAYQPEAVVRHWVPRDRLRPRYFRRWLYQNGRDVARLERSYPRSCHRLLGVPRYLWRQAAADGRTVLAMDSARRFAAFARLHWMAGYLRESWRGAPDRSPVGSRKRLEALLDPSDPAREKQHAYQRHHRDLQPRGLAR